MKKYIILMLFVLVGSATFAQFGFLKGITQAQADARYPKLTDSVAGYTAAEIDELLLFPQYTQYEIAMFRLTGYKYVKPFSGSNMFSGNSALVDGYAYYTLIYVSDTVVVDRFMFQMVTSTAAYTADNYNGIVLYSYNPTTKDYTEIIRTTNDGDIWKAVHNTYQEKTFTPTTLNPGFYATGFVWNASATTTAPIIATYGATSGVVYQFNGNHFLSALKSANADMPTTVNATVLSGVAVVHGITLRGQ